jgi:hypothetical protein
LIKRGREGGERWRWAQRSSASDRQG